MTSNVKLSLASGPLSSSTGDLLVIGVFTPTPAVKGSTKKSGKGKGASKSQDLSASDLGAQIGEVDEAFGGKLAAAAFAEGFRAQKGQSF
jgi:hypothetical protein